MILLALLALGASIPVAPAANEVLTITAIYPDSRLGSASLFVRGNGLGLNWSTGRRMVKAATNTWQIALDASGDVGEVVRFKVLNNDVTWQVGSDELVEISLNMGNRSVTIYPWFGTQVGSLVYERNVYSPQIGNTRDIVIYLPPSYTENTLKRFENVMVAHDGNNMFVRDSNCPSCCPYGCWNAHTTLNTQIIGGNMSEVVVVGVFNTPNRMNEYTYSVDAGYGGGDGDLYLDFLEDTVVPFIESRYRVETNTLVTLGSSLGGLISCYAGWTRSHTWKKAGCMSSSFWWNDEDFLGDILRLNSNPLPSTFVYLDSGSPGDGVTETNAVRDDMLRRGKVYGEDLFHYTDNGGGHNEASWGDRFYIPMRVLFPVPILVPV